MSHGRALSSIYLWGRETAINRGGLGRLRSRTPERFGFPRRFREFPLVVGNLPDGAPASRCLPFGGASPSDQQGPVGMAPCDSGLGSGTFGCRPSLSLHHWLWGKRAAAGRGHARSSGEEVRPPANGQHQPARDARPLGADSEPPMKSRPPSRHLESRRSRLSGPQIPDPQKPWERSNGHCRLGHLGS